MFDRLLWWSSAVLAYIVTAGLATLLVRLYRKKTYVEGEPYRSDRGAGFLLGGVKAFVIASFLVAAILKYAPTDLKVGGGWVEEQFQTSRTLVWAKRYRPADQIWNAPPVQAFIQRIRSRGLGNPEPTESETPSSVAGPESKAEPDKKPLRTASRPRALQVPRPFPVAPERRLDPKAPSFLRDIEREMRREGIPLTD